MEFPRTDAEIRVVMDKLFARYDFNHNGTLEKSEVIAWMNDSFAQQGNRKVSEQELTSFI